MHRNVLAIGFGLACALAPSALAGALDGLTAAQIVEKNVAARGGLQNWRAVQTITYSGKIGAGGNQRATLALPTRSRRRNNSPEELPKRPAEEVRLPFVMELKRPGKSRLELQFKGLTAVQVWDGAQGWKFRPYLNRADVEPFTADETKGASLQADLDGYLIDADVKGTKVELDGTEKVEDRDAYRLKLTLRSGASLHVWVDAHSFLELKAEGQPRRLDGVEHRVEVYYHDYRIESGLMIPHTLETHVASVPRNALGMRDTPIPPESAVIEKVVVNPKLEDALFTKPGIVMASALK